EFAQRDSSSCRPRQFFRIAIRLHVEFRSDSVQAGLHFRLANIASEACQFVNLHQVTGVLNDDPFVDNEIEEWIEAA
ncbi:hypothetical protein ACC713_38320, partial [Rhizobium johnstonii]